MIFQFKLLHCLLVGFALSAQASKNRPRKPDGTLHTRDYFYAGGSYVKQGSSDIAHAQMYVEHLVPATVTQEYPILVIHGDGMTGTNFLNTPDGRLGWADYFMSQGYEESYLDQPARGRSAWQENVDGNLTNFDTYTVESHFTAVQRFDLWPQASLHTQWPGNGSVGDETFDAFYMSMMQSLASEVESSQLVQAAGSTLLDEIGPVILLTHSQSGQYGWPLADAHPSQVKAIVALEPIGPPFQNAVFSTDAARPYGVSEIPLNFSPPISSPDDLHPVPVSSTTNFTCYQQSPPARQLPGLANVPVLVVTSQASYHAVYDNCTVQFLTEAGVHAEHLQLEDVGIYGNAHMMFMEKNGLEIAEQVILKWLHQTL
ncbi:hypothetical protein SERLA73DRAFT_113625 [Serpula lacrymans var. lacrymans S7.3]|uniref:Uncharacterized protein n=2 Tax=Serpula lacrymans var. lacrymans TaxID=341189 RepID=F8Q8K9_SERL3|nr:uncharacterized protein SERLADRAFT_357946 [Serpula lacrymans var. lacrymans S7.9]EGN95897.1 hypothetical protein SERLA73DRAFT_113625 [Serpula lacrymans var. lacrymans S7.3]EGO21411.1 hypothetical protein SERLADRAFT_357946 [Serpula lacrymans var. lacrymans S7.9]